MERTFSLRSLITVISLFFVVIWLSPAFAAGAPAFTSLGEIRADALRIPGAIDLDESGNLYVADARGGLVHMFDQYGNLQKSLDLQASGRGLAVTPDGALLYVARENSVQIVELPSGEIVGALEGAESDLSEFGVVAEIDLDANGNVFVVDGRGMLVKFYDAAGQYLGSLGGVGPGVGQFMQIGGMAVNSAGQVVVTDSSATNAKVHVFTLDADLNAVGVVAYSNGSAANFGSPAMLKPRGLTFDDQGRGYFLDFKTSQVRVTSESFGFLGAYNQVGYEAGQLNNVIDAVFDNVNNRLFVGCDTGRIEILGVDGGQNPVHVNHAPTSPVLKSPIAGSEVLSATPTLVINNALDEDGDSLTYHVIVKQDDAVVFQADVSADAGETTTVDVSTELVENAVFTWTAQATDGQLFSAVSSSASFVVNAAEEAPSVPVLSSPVNGESISGLEVLSWEASTDPDPNDFNVTYYVEVALDEDFLQTVAAESLVETSLPLGALTSYGDLEDGVDYFWRVIALDEMQVASEQSALGKFVYDTTALTVIANMPDATVSFYGNHAYAGQEIGVAPIELRDFAPGTLSVVVERDGFETFVAQITITEGENIDLYATLSPAVIVDKLSASRRGINGRSGLSVSDDAVPFLVDFNNDGDLDLLVGDASGQITQFANMQHDGRSKVYFDQGVSLGLPVMPNAVPFVADWNNDGRKDLIVGQADGSVKLFINDGLEEAPAFASGVDVQTVSGALNAGSNSAPAVIDYNNDGAKDLLVGNASGQVLVFINQGTDDAPVLADPVVALQLSGTVVPMPVDWDADGQKELMLTVGGKVTLYYLVDGQYQAGQSFSGRRAAYVGAFPFEFDGSGKKLLVGQADGQLAYLVGSNNEFVASFHEAMLDKVDELGGFVAEVSPELLGDVTAISSLVAIGDYASAALEANALALKLAVGAAQTSALELAELCQF